MLIATEQSVVRTSRSRPARSARGALAACVAALLVTVMLSLMCGWVAGFLHVLCVAAGWAYDLGVKATVWSWVSFTVAFGGLPGFVTLSDPGADVPPLWVVAAAALLGVGAHLVNVLPDLDDDKATGVRGMSHGLGHEGRRWQL